MASGAANRGGGNRGRLCRGKRRVRCAAQSVGEAEAAFSIEAARLACACPMDRARVRQYSAWKSRVGSQILQSRSKGTAVSMLLRGPWARHRVPVYFGDDRTDFDAFSVIHGRGLAIRIGGRRGAAGEDAWIPHPKKLHSILDWLAARQQGGETDRK